MGAVEAATTSTAGQGSWWTPRVRSKVAHILCIIFMMSAPTIYWIGMWSAWAAGAPLNKWVLALCFCIIGTYLPAVVGVLSWITVVRQTKPEDENRIARGLIVATVCYWANIALCMGLAWLFSGIKL